MTIVPPDEPAGELGLILATATDSAQPVSNALYAAAGIVPRIPLWSLSGGPGASGLPPLPSEVTVLSFADIAADPTAGSGHEMLVAAVACAFTSVVGSLLGANVA